ncbi:MAG: sugar ABC transporter permease [Anaerolineae bacterium]|nr:sugar ABC transporter permease [Anaerolineae bacterium]
MDVADVVNVESPKRSAVKRPAISPIDRYGWLSSIPLIVIMLVLFAYPAFNAVRLTVVNTDGTWLGFSRYEEAFTDPRLYQSARYSLIFTFSSVALHLIFGLSMAIVLTNKKRSPRVLGVFRGLLLLPWIVSMVVAAPMIILLFHQVGLINYFVKDLLGLVSKPIGWLSDPTLAPIFVILVSGWQGFPIFMILFISSIQGIPSDRYEAAALDGAGFWQSFRYITLPGVTGTALRVIVFDFIWMWKAFEIVFILTSGGPGTQTTLLSYFIYTLAFGSLKLNYAATIAVLMTIVSIIISFLLLRVPEPEVAD